MGQRISKLPSLAPFIMVLLVVAGQFSCDGSSDVVSPPERNTYAVTGVLVKDLNTDLSQLDSSWIAVRLWRNDTLLSDAGVVLDDDTLVFDHPAFPLDSVYSFAFSPPGLVAAGSHQLSLKDQSRFSDAFAVNVPDTFRVSSYTGDSTVPNAGGVEMQIAWTAAQNAEGYGVAVVKDDQVYTGAGYTKYVTETGTQTTIPPEAFRLSAGELVVGTYYIFIYAFAGSPDSTFTSELLPVPLRSQLSDNIDRVDLGGRFGSVVVTRRVPKVVEVIP
ncbi:MAG: hypothetical protein JSW34_03015 [Candidatus Zixiibacteriota bacterium]|nr:MAG: hypothetical protein JSW34_03015 [candidate division Zixibacteria bacterium]